MAPHRIDTHHHPYPPVYVEKTRDDPQAHHPRVLRPADEVAAEPGGRGDGQGRHRRLGALDRDAQRVARRRAASRTLARECNDAAAKMQSDYKGRFGHFATIPLPDVDGSLREIEYLYGTLKADGIALTTNYDDKYPGEDAFAPVFDELNRRKAVVYFHPTAASFAFNRVKDIPPPTIEFPFDTTRTITSLLFSGTFSRCPDIKWIFSHGGGALGMVANRLAGLAKNRPELGARVPNGVKQELSKLYLDVVGVTTPGALAAVLDIVPMSQLLFGTDYPFWAPDITVNGLAALKLVAADLAAIERGNALKLMPGLGRSTATTSFAAARYRAAP